MQRPRKQEIEWMRLFHELTPQQRAVARGLVLVKQNTPPAKSSPPRRFEFVAVQSKPWVLGE